MQTAYGLVGIDVQLPPFRQASEAQLVGCGWLFVQISHLEPVYPGRHLKKLFFFIILA